MAPLDVDSYGIPSVTVLVDFFEDALETASAIKPHPTVEPPLEEADLEPVLARMPASIAPAEPLSIANARQRNSSKFAIIETAARGLLSNLIARVSIDVPDYVKVWNFFDILQCLSDRGQCDPALLVWLIEELLDSQTIPGCRKIFDYLESRRKRIISKNFNDKKLVILRSCNELLRRLSRAEDTAFSGRVFIFLFQSLPPGDKSSVNLRGEYHTQNVTSYDQVAPKVEEAEDKMEVDQEIPAAKETNGQAQSKSVSFSERKENAAEKPLDPDALYPMFWSLQESFNQPKKLFEAAHLAQFKTGLEETMKAFKANPVQHDAKSSKQGDDNRGIKRKLDAEEEEALTSFNPKYLTSRDLFELEIGDLSLRRYVLVQALIIIEFLLSLTAEAKQTLLSINSVNRSVAYLDQTLSEEDEKWVKSMKLNVTEYLKSATDGHFFLRMVETILSRDKNWVRWKIENCPIIERAAISPKEWAAAMSSSKREATSKKVRLNTTHPLNLDFLKENDDVDVMEELKDPKRYQLPDIKSFQKGLQEADFDLGFPNPVEKERELKEHKASLAWRALRIASRTKLAVFDKIDSYEDINVLFEEPKLKAEEENEEDGEEEEDKTQKNGETEEAKAPAVENGATQAAEVVMADEIASQPGPESGAPVEAMETNG
ncbi:unnamed protein product [Discula destructiva]